jgi:PKD repeat protein
MRSPMVVRPDNTKNPPEVPPIQFTDLSTGVITEWIWDFGYSYPDGTRAGSNEQNPQHTFPCWNQPFTVSLTVIGPGGSNTKIWPDCIRVSGCG